MRQLIALLCLILVLPISEANAASYLKCLEQSKGKYITWNPQWDSDRADRGTKYQVKKIRIVNKIPDRIVTLELRAKDRATRKSRTVTVKTEERARPICESVHVIRRSLGLPGNKGGISSQPPEYSLPFIRYTKDGWVRAKHPERILDLSVCRVHKREFSCLKDEKDRWGTWLKSVEEEIRWSGS